MTRTRCFGDGDPLYERYHDEEWGRPVTDERGLFERMSLEAFQSGLSWLTILRKRENFRAAFHGFDPRRVAAFGADDRARLMADAGIVRNGAKIDAAIANAAATLSRLRTIPVSAISRATSASSNRATRSISNPANAARKCSRLRRIVSHDSPDWNASSVSRSYTPWSVRTARPHSESW